MIGVCINNGASICHKEAYLTCECPDQVLTDNEVDSALWNTTVSILCRGNDNCRSVSPNLVRLK